MLQKSFQDIERDFLCDICGQAVTNPLCPVCLTTEIEAWLTLYPDLRSSLKPRLHKYLIRIKDRANESTQCIRCNNKRASICPYCFTEHVLNELKKLHSNKIVLREFLQFFNFDLEHKGYSKEAEKLGVI
jgi:hypothetical protein